MKSSVQIVHRELLKYRTRKSSTPREAIVTVVFFAVRADEERGRLERGRRSAYFRHRRER